MIAFGTRQWLSLYLAEKRALARDRADGRDRDEQDALAGRRTHGVGVCCQIDHVVSGQEGGGKSHPLR